MTRLFRPAALAAIFGATILLAVACSGHGDTGTSGDAGKVPGPPIPGSLMETPGGPETPLGSTGPVSGTAGPTETTTPGRGLPTADSLNALASYRYQLTLEGKGSIAESFAITGVTGGGSDT